MGGPPVHEGSGPRTTDRDGLDTAVLRCVIDVVAELRGGAPPLAVTLDSRLERDLGLDSLAIAELQSRLEQAFDVTLGETVLARVESPRDLADALLTAAPPRVLDRARAAAGSTLPYVLAPEHATTLLEVLDAHVAEHADRTHVTVLGEGGEDGIDYGSLHDEAAAVAQGLFARGVEPGETVALMLPTGRSYFTTFIGVLQTGAVPVPIYPPARRSQLEDHLRRHARILDNAGAAMLVTVPEARLLARLLSSEVPSLREVVSASELPTTGHERAPRVSPHDLALVQYTSGSTGAPKGVMLTHANLLANIRAMAEAAAVTSDDVFVSWLPLYHDMGLIGAWLGSLYAGFPLVIMPPTAFLTRPVRWLQTITDYRGTISASPNFGYELCLTKIPDDQLEGLDLRSWRLAFNGAEPVSAFTVERFTARFARCGLRANAMAPVYGLAESCVGLAFPPLERGPRVDRVARDVLARSGEARPARHDDSDAVRVVSCGRALPGHALRVVDSVGAELPDRHEGRIEFRGPSATSGYFRNPEAARALHHGEWLETGDLGYLADGEVYVTGRVKDIVIRAGRNLHPDELETAVGELAGVRTGRVAAFAATDTASGTERLVVLAETREVDEARRAELRDAILGITLDLLGTPPDDVVLVPPGTVLKTSSGKVRRAACRELYERGRLHTRTRPAWWQLARVAGSAVTPRLRRVRHAFAGALFAVYAWLCVAVLVPPALVALAVVPGLRRRWRIAAACVRALLRATHTPFEVHGAESLPGEPCVVVANHASWLDAVLLAAALPGTPCFVGASELARRRIVRLVLVRLGAELVERTGREQSIADTHRLLEAARRGVTLVVFPEGGLARRRGLRPFHLGAFVVAASAGRPVVPVAIRGSRTLLAPGSARPRRSSIDVTVTSALRATGNGWRDAIELRDRARAAIRERCGEPDLS